MIQIISGRKGSGKTKRLIDMTNHSAREGKADVIFIDDDNRYMFDISHKARFINAGEYGIMNAEMFLGFLCGMLAQNFDVGQIFVDAFLKLVKADMEQLEWLFERMEALCQKHSVEFILSVSADTDHLPEYAKKYEI